MYHIHCIRHLTSANKSIPLSSSYGFRQIRWPNLHMSFYFIQQLYTVILIIWFQTDEWLRFVKHMCDSDQRIHHHSTRVWPSILDKSRSQEHSMQELTHILEWSGLLLDRLLSPQEEAFQDSVVRSPMRLSPLLLKGGKPHVEGGVVIWRPSPQNQLD